MMAQVNFILWDRAARRVVGHGNIAGENWDTHQAHLTNKRGLEMAPIFDAGQLDMLRHFGPHNFRVREDSTLEMLPPEQRNLTPEVIDNHDDGMDALNRKMDILIDLMRPVAAMIMELTKG